MRWSLTTSLFLHAAILAAAFVVLPNPDEFKVEEQESIPVDIVSIEDLGNARRRRRPPEKPVEKPRRSRSRSISKLSRRPKWRRK